MKASVTQRRSGTASPGPVGVELADTSYANGGRSQRCDAADNRRSVTAVEGHSPSILNVTEIWPEFAYARKGPEGGL